MKKVKKLQKIILNISVMLHIIEDLSLSLRHKNEKVYNQQIFKL